ncbi:hypothetical protein HZC35_02695 [Candidatus Saganbacteria bacterium]|nr:hypothetical protein [Candidatus Saganbacteria bacterium]
MSTPSAIQAQDLVQYLAGLGLNPQQISQVVYGLYRELRVSGSLTPAADNMVHLSVEKIKQMAKDPALEEALQALALSVQKSKNLDALFQKGPKTSATPAAHIPLASHNPYESTSTLPESAEAQQENVVIHNLDSFLRMTLGGYVDGETIKGFVSEQEILNAQKD